jgi:hypothetical protein
LGHHHHHHHPRDQEKLLRAMRHLDIVHAFIFGFAAVHVSLNPTDYAAVFVGCNIAKPA